MKDDQGARYNYFLSALNVSKKFLQVQVMVTSRKRRAFTFSGARAQAAHARCKPGRRVHTRTAALPGLQTGDFTCRGIDWLLSSGPRCSQTNPSTFVFAGYLLSFDYLECDNWR